MSQPSLATKRLAERILGKGGDLPLALLLELLVPVARLRELARSHGLSPKGGFRVDRAPAHVLAPLLAEQRDAARLDEVLGLLLPVGSSPAPTPAAEEPVAAPAEASALAALREAELARAREEVERLREAAARGRSRESELARRLELAERDRAVLQASVARLERAPAERGQPAHGDRELQRRVQELEDEREGFLAADNALRRQLAYVQTRRRELEQLVAELEPLVPKSRRQQRAAAREAEPPPVEFRLPYFAPSFYKSLVGKERTAVERAVHAVLLFCTEGYGYPGLEVKQMGGQDTWSLRASRSLRVYFRPRSDGDVDILELADREEQHTTLRRLKER
jgi:hypothetical protein